MKNLLNPKYHVLLGIGAFAVALLDYTVIHDEELGVLGKIACGVILLILAFWVVTLFSTMIIQMFKKK